MRLLDVRTLDFQDFPHDQVPSYAIASHRWGDDADEVRFKDITRRRNTHSPGYRKVEGFAKYVREHLQDIHYLWIDTCCIRQDSDREVSEAVNSMFRYYQQAQICLAYLADVQSRTDLEEFEKSVWHRRGWTLQELLAPRRVLFLTRDWELIGCKAEHEADTCPALKSTIALATGLPEDVLDNYDYSKRYSTEEKFRWTSGRRTTRPEDQVYCLLGVSDVAMPVIYGEGFEKATKRLLGEIRATALEANREPISVIPYHRNVAFVDRPRLLRRVRTALAVPAARVALVGLGGIGKTQLALEYAHRLRGQENAPWVLWLHANSPSRLEHSVQEIAQRLRLPGHDVTDADTSLLFYNWLSDEKHGKWLLVLDNVDDSNVVLRPFPAKTCSTPSRKWLDYVPTCEHGSILITSRSKVAASDIVSDTQIVEVPAMDDSQAQALLTQKLDSAADNDDLQELAKALEHHPLAITQAATYIRERAPRSTVQSYLKELEESTVKRMKLLCWDPKPLDRNEHASSSVLLTLRTSFDLLMQTKKSAAGLLSLMSLCDRLAIPEILIHDPRVQSKDTALASEGIVLPQESERFEEDILLLRSFSLISTKTEDTWQMCQLVQDAVRLWLSERQEIQTWTAALAHSLAAATPPILESEDSSVYSTLLPHVKCAMGMRPVDREAFLCWAKVMRAHACFHRTRGNITDAEALAEAASDAMVAEFGIQHVDALQSMDELALVRQKQGRYVEAQQLRERALEAVKADPDNDHSEALLSHKKHLAIVYLALDKHEEAGKLFQEVLDAHETNGTKESAEDLQAIRSLGSKLIDLNKYEEAKELLEKLLTSDRRTFGEEHPESLECKHNLGISLYENGRLDEAERTMSDVVERRTRVLGYDNVDTLSSMHERADYLGIIAAVAKRRRKVLGSDHVNTLRSMHNRADFLHVQGKFNEAQAAIADVVERKTRVLGSDHVGTLSSMHNRAYFLYAQGRLNEAETAIAEVVKRRTRVLGPDHVDTLYSNLMLANCFMSQGKLCDAEKLMSEVVERSTRILGSDHVDVLGRVHILALILSKQGKLREAVKLGQRAVDGRTKVLGAEHPDTVASAKNLTFCRKKLQDQERVNVEQDSSGESQDETSSSAGKTEIEPAAEEEEQKTKLVGGQTQSRTSMKTQAVATAVSPPATLQESRDTVVVESPTGPGKQKRRHTMFGRLMNRKR